MQRKKYNTRMTSILQAEDLDPDVWFKTAVNNGWPVMEMFLVLKAMARKHRLKMVDRRTVYTWASKYNGASPPK